MNKADRLLHEAFSRQVKEQDMQLKWSDIVNHLPATPKNQGTVFNGLVYVLSISLLLFLMIVRVQPTKLRQQFTQLVQMSQDPDRESDVLYKSAPYMFKRRNL